MDHSESGVVRQKWGPRLPAAVASRRPDNTSKPSHRSRESSGSVERFTGSRGKESAAGVQLQVRIARTRHKRAARSEPPMRAFTQAPTVSVLSTSRKATDTRQTDLLSSPSISV